MSCSSFLRQIYHFQADELPEGERQALQEHLNACPPCARRLEIEAGLLRGLKARLGRDAAPEDLRWRVRGALRKQAPSAARGGWLRAPWLAASAASVMLAVLLFSGGSDLRPELAAIADVERVVRVVTVVDVDCDRAGMNLGQQRECTHPHHLNALKVADGGYWNISLDQDAFRSLAVDRNMRGHQLRVEGDLYGNIRTLRLSGVTDLGLTRQTALARPRAVP